MKLLTPEILITQAFTLQLPHILIDLHTITA